MSFSYGYQGQGNTTTQNAIATAMGAGVIPADYKTAAYYQYHQMMGQNVMTAPNLLGMESPLLDTPYPSKAQLTALGIQSLAEGEVVADEAVSEEAVATGQGYD